MHRSSIQGIVAGACMFLLTFISMVTSAGTQAYAKALPQAGSAPAAVTVRAIVLVQTGRSAVLAKYTVLPGNTLSGIARLKCGHANEWTGIYAASRKVVGGNPDFILPGQVLTLKCTDPPVLPAHTAAKPRSGTYGHPYYCGDGDGDGWDVTCPKNVVHTSPAKSHSSGSSSSVQLTGKDGGSSKGCSDPSGHLTASQVGMLWVCAGGPAWAEAAAIRVSSCESGWNTHAFNPSGASGLWQILGAVVGGYIFDAHVNALNAVSKFRASGDSWAQWVCKP